MSSVEAGNSTTLTSWQKRRKELIFVHMLEVTLVGISKDMHPYHSFKIAAILFVLSSKEMVHANPFQNGEKRLKVHLQLVFGQTCFACWWYYILYKISTLIGLYLCPIITKAWIREMTSINSTVKEKRKGFASQGLHAFRKKPNLDVFVSRNFKH